ncbi:hypothetical protein TNCV_4319741 [Trichonephila clavipes]|nr:hypothetical protein TNCV_4319741 [Trichonephila clavipes]
MQGNRSFASCSYHARGRNVCSGHINLSTGRVINGRLFSLWMSPGLSSKVILGIFSFGENLELIFIHDTFVKKMHMDQTVSVFEVVSLWVDAQISMSISMEIIRQMTSWILMCLFPYARAIDDAFMLQDDNARPHWVCIMDVYLKREKIQLVQWST